MKTSKPWLYAGVRAFDAIVGPLARRPPRPIPASPERVLVSNVGHLGDALFTLAVPAAIRAAIPAARVDVLASTASAVLFQGHPSVDRVLSYDHPLLSSGPPARRLRLWRDSLRRALPELEAARYDLALELRSYVPNSLPLLTRAAMPCIVGFGTGGFSFLLDHAVPHVDGEHELERFARVLRVALGERAGAIGDLHPDVCHLAAPRETPTGGAPYAVLHPGTRRRRKRWSDPSWRDVASALHEGGLHVVVTGSEAEERWLDHLFRGIPVEISAGRTGLAELTRLCRDCALFIGVDSFVTQLAAAAGAPRVLVLWHPWADPDEWRPLGGDRTSVLPGESRPADVLKAAGVP